MIFLKFLNQPIDGSLNNSLTTFKDSHVFENVWDREYIEFHATFSDSKKTLLEEGMNSTINHHYSLKHQMMGQYFMFDLQVMVKRQYFLDIVDSLFNYVSYLIIKTR